VEATSSNPWVPHRNPKLDYEALLNGIVVTGFQLRARAISQGLELLLQSCAQAHGSSQCTTDHSHIQRYKARLTRRVQSKSLVTSYCNRSVHCTSAGVLLKQATICRLGGIMVMKEDDPNKAPAQLASISTLALVLHS
jgi:hypothetical protein